MSDTAQPQPLGSTCQYWPSPNVFPWFFIISAGELILVAFFVGVRSKKGRMAAADATFPTNKSPPEYTRVHLYQPEQVFHLAVYALMTFVIFLDEYIFGIEEAGIGKNRKAQLITIVVGQTAIQASTLFFQVRVYQMRDLLRQRLYPIEEFDRIKKEFRNNHIYYLIIFFGLFMLEWPIRLSYAYLFEANFQEIRSVILSLVFISLAFFYLFFLSQIGDIFQLKKIHYKKKTITIPICYLYGFAMVFDLLVGFFILGYS